MPEQRSKFLPPVLMISALGAACSGASSSPPQAHPRPASVINRKRVLMQHNDLGRTGAYLDETTLNVKSVSGGLFGKLFSRVVDGPIYAQPLYMAAISVPNLGVHNIVYVATEHNSVFAYDADFASQDAPLWQVYLGPPVPFETIDPTCNLITPEIGITSTPVIDPSTNTLYVSALTLDDDGPRYWLHALDVSTGLERQHSPVAIEATVAGDGTGNQSGKIVLDAKHHLNRPGLLLSNGVVYLAFGSYCDIAPYHGWILGYDAATLAQRYVFNDSPHGGLGGIWQAGNGLSADTDGNIYALTGNGSFDMDQGGPDLGESVVKLTPDAGKFTLSDWFTPHDEQELQDNDWDLATGAVLPPDNNLLIGGNKQGTLYVLDRRNLGHFRKTDDGQILQRLQVSSGGIFTSPVYWHGPQGGLLYLWASMDRLRAFSVSSSGLSQSTVAVASETGPPAPLSISANGTAAGTGVLWAIQPGGIAVLRAYDAEDITHELWSSAQNPSRDALSGYNKFTAPTIVNGKVYAPSADGQLYVFGMLPN